MMLIETVYAVSIDVNYTTPMYINECQYIKAKVYDNGLLVTYPECQVCYDNQCYSMASSEQEAYYYFCPSKVKTYYFNLQCYDNTQSFSIDVIKRPSKIEVDMPEEIKVQDYVYVKIYYTNLYGDLVGGTCNIKLYKDGSSIDEQNVSYTVCDSTCYYPYSFMVDDYGEYSLKIECSSNVYETSSYTYTFYPEKLEVNAWVEYPSVAYTYEEIPIKIYYPGEKCDVEIDYGEYYESRELTTKVNGFFEVNIGPFYDEKTIYIYIKCGSKIYKNYTNSIVISVLNRDLYSDLRVLYSFYYEDLPTYIVFHLYDNKDNAIINADCNVERFGNYYRIFVPKKDAGQYKIAVVCKKRGYNDFRKDITIKILEQPTRVEIITDRDQYYTYQTMEILPAYYSTKGKSLYGGTCEIWINNEEYTVKPFEKIKYYIGSRTLVYVKVKCSMKNYEESYASRYIYIKRPRILVDLYLPSEIYINKVIKIRPYIRDELGRIPKDVKCRLEYYVKDFFGKIIESGSEEFKDKTNLSFSKAGKLYIKIKCSGPGYVEGIAEKYSKVVVISEKQLPLIASFAISGMIGLILALKIIKSIIS